MTRWMRLALVMALSFATLGSMAARADDLDDAMVAYMRAIRGGDTATFLRFISPERPWRFVSYRAGASNIVTTTTFDKATTEEAINGRHGLYSALFAGTNQYRYTERLGAHPLSTWNRNGVTYRIPDRDGISFVYWRKEDGQWKIDSIGDDAP